MAGHRRTGRKPYRGADEQKVAPIKGKQEAAKEKPTLQLKCPSKRRASRRGGGSGKDKKDAAVARKPTVDNAPIVVDDEEALAVDLPQTRTGEYRVLTAASRASLTTARAWVDDEVVTAWLNLTEGATDADIKVLPPMLSDKLNRGVTPKKVLSKVELGRHMMVIPCIQGKHWTLAVHRPGRPTVEWYNSLEGYPVMPSPVQQWVAGRCAPTKVTRTVFYATPQQRNGDDCGVLMCLVALAIAKGRAFNPCWGDHTDEARLWIDRCLNEGTISDHPMFNWAVTQDGGRPTVSGSRAIARCTTAMNMGLPTHTQRSGDHNADAVQQQQLVNATGPHSNNTVHQQPPSGAVRVTATKDDGPMDGEEPGDDEDDDDMQLDTFIKDVALGKVAPKVVNEGGVRKDSVYPAS